jgi:ketosteroid isomerase-like protein
MIKEASMSSISDTPDNGSGLANVAAARRFFDLLSQRDVEAWGALWHEEARITVPYPADGFPSVIEGKDQILTGFRALMANYRSFESELRGVYPAADSDAVCVEYHNTAVLADGTDYTNDNIAVFRFRDGLISEYHDYFDPRRFQTVIDHLPTGSD